MKLWRSPARAAEASQSSDAKMRERITETAQKLGARLDDSVIEGLIGPTEPDQIQGRMIDRYGLWVRPPLRRRIGDGREVGLVSGLDFKPRTPDSPTGAKTPERQHATQIMLACIRGWQSYILLMEAGYYPRPDFFEGKTNDEMARFARRFGFTEMGRAGESGESVALVASYEDIRERVFSNEMAQTEGMLAQRHNQHAVAVGAAVLST